MQPLLHQSALHKSCLFGAGQDIRRQHVRQKPATAKEHAFQGRRRTAILPLARKDGESAVQDKPSRGVGLGELLGPIGLSLGRGKDEEDTNNEDERRASNGRASTPGNSRSRQTADSDRNSGGPELGPIALSFGGGVNASQDSDSGDEFQLGEGQSIHSMTTDKWQQMYEADGYVDLWVQEEFNSGSRLVGGRDVHKGGSAGFGSGEGQSAGAATRHHVRIFNHYADQEVEVDVPEDRYILWEAEEQGLLLPYACRMGCCTACAVRIKEGEMYQPQSLGVSAELKEAGYALMCVGYPRSDLVLETVEEDEVYDLQFGRSFAEQAVDPSNRESIERDEWALEIANMDE